MQAEAERRAAAARAASAAAAPAKGQLEAPAPLEENVNRLLVDGEEARTVEEAIAVLRWAEWRGRGRSDKAPVAAGQPTATPA